MIALAIGGVVLDAGQILAQTKAHPGLEKLKSLVGVWEGKRSDGRAVKVTYRLISGGLGLMEILAAAEEDEMVTVYHPDGARLRLTHHCSAGNQPRMQAEVLAGEIKNLTFSLWMPPRLSLYSAMLWLCPAIVSKRERCWMS